MRDHRPPGDPAQEIGDEGGKIGLGVAPALGVDDADEVAARRHDHGLTQEGAGGLGREGEKDAGSAATQLPQIGAQRGRELTLDVGHFENGFQAGLVDLKFHGGGCGNGFEEEILCCSNIAAIRSAARPA